MKPGALCIRLTSPDGSTPPLREATHGSVVKCHLVRQSHHPASSAPDPQTELGFFSGRQGFIEATRCTKGLDPKHAVPSAVFGLAHRRIPLHVSKTMVDVSLSKAFPQAAADDCHVRVLLEVGNSRRQPAGLDFGIAVHELHELQASQPFFQDLQAGVAPAGSRQGDRCVQLHHLDADLLRPGHAPIAGTAIDVDDMASLFLDGCERAAQPAALIAPDHHDPKPIQFQHRQSRILEVMRECRTAKLAPDVRGRQLRCLHLKDRSESAGSRPNRSAHRRSGPQDREGRRGSLGSSIAASSVFIESPVSTLPISSSAGPHSAPLRPAARRSA